MCWKPGSKRKAVLACCLPALAEAGYHVIAPDQCGYGRTTGWKSDYDGGLHPFRLLNLVRVGAVGRIPIGRADECAVRRVSGAAAQHGGCATNGSLRTRLAVYRASQRSIGIAAPGLTRGK
jgi:pimeloyl-ACP methyl ester carboxylesterase